LDLNVFLSKVLLDLLGKRTIGLDQDVIRALGRVLDEIEGPERRRIGVKGVAVDGNDSHVVRVSKKGKVIL
jgi:hypothetical protein